jgi:putative DNA primase/helicase
MKTSIEALKRWLHTLAQIITAPAIPLPAHCCNISGLLLHMCDGDRDLHKWVLRWIALPLRDPGAKMSTCLAFNGPDARSMELLVEVVLMSLHGPRAREIHGDDLTRIFNPWTSGARLVVVHAGTFLRAPVAQLKTLAISSQVWINEQGKPERVERNHANFIYLSNQDDFLPIGTGCRRFTVIETPPAPSLRFHRAVIDEIQNGGIEAFHAYLVNDLDMADFTTSTPPPGPTHILPQISAARAA